ncbi:hypothetical protein ACKRZS_002598 [Fusarium odoratissimum]
MQHFSAIQTFGLGRKADASAKPDPEVSRMSLFSKLSPAHREDIFFHIHRRNFQDYPQKDRVRLAVGDPAGCLMKPRAAQSVA